jgi:phosphotransacetylase
MSTVIDSIVRRAQDLKKTVGLPEAHDPRTIIAAREAMAKGLARIVLVSKPEDAASAASEADSTLEGLEIIDPTDEAIRTRNAKLLFELRK